jgi:hypothetical protein
MIRTRPSRRTFRGEAVFFTLDLFGAGIADDWLNLTP